MLCPYPHALIDSRPGPTAEVHNAPLLGPRTLGIEVTQPVLATRCGLGNIDPQHRPDGGACAAIEAAQDWPLPPPGSRLVTIRPDLDAYGAMALLHLRAEQQAIGPEMQARIALVGAHDRFARGAWPGPRPLPASPDQVTEVGEGPQGLGAFVGGLADRALPIGVAVAIVRAWLLDGSVPGEWRDRAVGAADALLKALRDGRVRVASAADGRIAVVQGAVPGALRLGYRRAPVVVAVDHGSASRPRRITVAQWCVGHADLVRACELLAEQEAGWGGRPPSSARPRDRRASPPSPQSWASSRTVSFRKQPMMPSLF